MAVHSHKFVETYKGLVGFGLNRETDENTVKYYLEKFSDDQVLQSVTERLTDEELGELFGRSRACFGITWTSQSITACF